MHNDIGLEGGMEIFYGVFQTYHTLKDEEGPGLCACSHGSMSGMEFSPDWLQMFSSLFCILTLIHDQISSIFETSTSS